MSKVFETEYEYKEEFDGKTKFYLKKRIDDIRNTIISS